MCRQNERRLGLNAATLRWLALGFMLLDHMWATVIPGNVWMTRVGRLAFPIFAFQAAEGYFHTSDFKKYSLRLLGFGLLSEIPFNLMMGGAVFYPFHQNVMFTLLLGLLALRLLDRARQQESRKQRILAGLGALGLVLLGTVGLVDYGGRGVLTVVAFGLLRGFPGARLCQLLAMVLLNIVDFPGEQLLLSLPWGTLEFPAQGFAVLALIPIWLYTGEKGPRSKALQWGSYLFYPLHMLLLYGITQIL